MHTIVSSESKDASDFWPSSQQNITNTALDYRLQCITMSAETSAGSNDVLVELPPVSVCDAKYAVSNIPCRISAAIRVAADERLAWIWWLHWTIHRDDLRTVTLRCYGWSLQIRVMQIRITEKVVKF